MDINTVQTVSDTLQSNNGSSEVTGTKSGFSCGPKCIGNGLCGQGNVRGGDCGNQKGK